MTAQLISLAVIAGLAAIFIFVLRKGRGPVLPNDQGIARLRAFFVQTRKPDEREPICFVALEKSGLHLRQRFVGVTDQRWLVVDAAGQCKQVARQEQYTRYREDYFMRMFHDSDGYYEAKLTHPDFKGQKWRLYEQAQSFPEQRQQLKAMFDFVGFRWVT